MELAEGVKGDFEGRTNSERTTNSVSSLLTWQRCNRDVRHCKIFIDSQSSVSLIQISIPIHFKWKSNTFIPLKNKTLYECCPLSIESSDCMTNGQIRAGGGAECATQDGKGTLHARIQLFSGESPPACIDLIPIPTMGSILLIPGLIHPPLPQSLLGNSNHKDVQPVAAFTVEGSDLRWNQWAITAPWKPQKKKQRRRQWAELLLKRLAWLLLWWQF